MSQVNTKNKIAINEPLTANNGDIQREYREREILLSLNNDITAVRNKKDILKLIHPKIKLLFNTDDIFICFLDPLNETLDPILRVGGADRVKHPDYDRIVNSSFPIHDGFIDAILNSEEPILIDLESFSKSQPPPDYLKLSLSTGLSETLSISLHNAGEVIGILTLWSESRGFFTPAHKRLISEIANNISIVVVNILAKEEIAEMEEEKTILLALSNEIAALRNRDDFFEVVIHKIKKIFGVDGFAISQINADGKTYRAFKLEDQYKAKDPLFYNKILSDTYTVDDRVYNEIMNSEEPVLFRVDELAGKTNIPAYVEFWKNTGIREVVCVALRVGGKFTGTASFHSLKNSPIDIKSGLLKSVCAQLAVKVSNILAYEEIAKREEEKTILLSLSNEIAALKNRDDLFGIINSRLKSLFPIEEFGIAQIDTNRKTYSAFIQELEVSLNKHAEFRGITSDKFMVGDKIFTTIMNSEGPVLFDVESISEEPEMPAYVRFWKKAELRRVLGVPLRVSGKDIGFAILHIDKSGPIDIKSSLLKGVFAQLAVKISNILAYEEIANREDEKTILLSLCNAIAGMRNRNDFFDVVISQLKKIFTFDGFAITYIHEGGKTYGVFNVDRQYDVQNIPGYKNVLSQRLPVTDPTYSIIIHSEDPVLFNVDEMAPDDNVLTISSFSKSRGIKQLLSVPLRVGGKTIGAASFHFFEYLKIEPKRTLLKSICAQVAVAVSNILASEEIAKKEEEKTILLSLSNEIASLKSRYDLFNVVNTRIKSILSVSQFGIVKINEDRATHSAFMMDLGDSIMSQIDFAEVIKLKYSIHDRAFSQVMGSDDPVILNVNQLAEEPDPPDYVKFWKAVGFQNLLCLALRVGGNNIGSIFFCVESDVIDNSKINLLKGICAQLSVAVSNILANEKVLDQLNEINKYKQQLEDEKIYLKEEIESSHNYAEIIGDGPEIKKVFRLVTQVAYSDSTVLILGETGTGKELIARAIHNSSTRKNKLMVKVNCAALPASLIESELFGHERGSFTGAVERRIGKFELANNGTLFLDEIGEMTMELQVKLLRALQEKEIERVGGKTTIKTDVRIIAATNRDLEKLMEEGKFRSDLYYRLNIFPISLPPLRNRREDIPQLASYFIVRYSKKAGKKINTISNKSLQELVQYDWPGNIRELEHLIERSVLLATGDSIKEIHLPQQKKNLTGTEKGDIAIRTIDENEKEHILKILKHVKGRIGGAGGAAELLGVPTSTLNSRIKRLGIRKEHF